MRFIIVGAGSVGRSIASELTVNDNEVVLLDSSPVSIRGSLVPEADWILGDGSSPTVLEHAGARECDALIAATGDDRVNLVVSLLAKTVFGVPKVVARANHTANEWMFNSNWGIDVTASTPRSLSTVITAAVSVGQAVELTGAWDSSSAIYTIELPPESPLVGMSPADVPWPSDLLVAAVMRDGAPLSPSKCEELNPGDDLLLVAAIGATDGIAELEQVVLGSEGQA